MAHLKLCKYCKKVYKTVVPHGKVCDKCKLDIAQNKQLIEKQNKPKRDEQKQRHRETIEQMGEIIKEDPFAMIRM